MKALNIAASGMLAQELNVEVVSNNIANMRTTGFKRQRAEFADLLYQNFRRMGAETSDSGTIVPTGVQIGSGVRLTSTSRMMSQGSIEGTENALDVAVRGEGFFRVELPDGGTAYTRDGSFQLDDTGRVVTKDGYVIGGSITVPPEARDITINQEGLVTAVLADGSTSQQLGRIELARFINKAGLEAIGDNLFLETAASGAAQVGNAGSAGFGAMLQNQLETANVNPVSEISDLIAAQRAYEMNSRVIKAADEMLSSTASMR